MDTLTFMQNMAVILVAVGLVSVVFSRFGWPRAIGYILAGVLLGKYTFGGGLITQNAEATVEVLGQMGVMFLMFTLGLELNLQKLKKVGGVAAPVALLDAAVMMWLGHFVGTRYLGMSSVGGLFLGAAICDSATTVLAKTFSDLGWTQRKFYDYVMGITMCEDLLCVGIIALVTGVARSHGGSVDFHQVGISLGGLALFLTGIIVFGLLLIPAVLNRVGKMKDDESLLLSVLGFCFLVVFISIKLEYGVALGAFLVGMIASGSNYLQRLYRQSVALRSMFSAIFFVTIGLQVDPALIWLYKWQILLISGVVLFGKTINVTVGTLVTGMDVKSSLQTGMGLAQIGEFALIVAFLGVQLGVFKETDMFFPLVVGVSLFTTLLNAANIKLSDPLSNGLVHILPDSWKATLGRYGGRVRRFSKTENKGAKIRANFILLIVIVVLEASILLGANLLSDLSPKLESVLPSAFTGHGKTIMWICALLITIPCSIFFFYIARALSDAIVEVILPQSVLHKKSGVIFHRVVTVLVVGISLFVLIAVGTQFSQKLLPEDAFIKWLIIIFIVLLGYVGWTKFDNMGKRAVKSLSDVMTKNNSVPLEGSVVDLFDIHTDRVEVGKNEKVAGRTLREIDFRRQTGASIIGIERKGENPTVNPKADDTLQEGDLVLLLGNDEQIEKARQFLA